jgi:hypothetical protein
MQQYPATVHIVQTVQYMLPVGMLALLVFSIIKLDLNYVGA